MIQTKILPSFYIENVMNAKSLDDFLTANTNLFALFSRYFQYELQLMNDAMKKSIDQ